MPRQYVQESIDRLKSSAKSWLQQSLGCPSTVELFKGEEPVAVVFVKDKPENSIWLAMANAAIIAEADEAVLLEDGFSEHAAGQELRITHLKRGGHAVIYTTPYEMVGGLFMEAADEKVEDHSYDISMMGKSEFGDIMAQVKQANVPDDIIGPALEESPDVDDGGFGDMLQSLSYMAMTADEDIVALWAPCMREKMESLVPPELRGKFQHRTAGEVFGGGIEFGDE